VLRYGAQSDFTIKTAPQLSGAKMNQKKGLRLLRPEVIKSVAWGLIVTVLLAIAIIVRSRNLSRFDTALVAYTFASLFAAFGLTYRYAMWLQRPPTALYWRRGWEAFFKRSYRKQNTITWFKRMTADFALNRFIWLRGKYRWLAHWLIILAPVRKVFSYLSASGADWRQLL
jgi:hypothetical protein